MKFKMNSSTEWLLINSIVNEEKELPIIFFGQKALNTKPKA